MESQAFGWLYVINDYAIAIYLLYSHILRTYKIACIIDSKCK